MTDDLRSALDDLVRGLPHDPVLPSRTARRVARRRAVTLTGTAAGGAGALALVVGLVLTTTGPGDDRLLVPADRPTPSASTAPLPVPEPAPSAAPSSRPGSDVPTPGPQRSASSPAPSRSPAATPARVVLRPDGLGLADGSTSSSLAFGSAAQDVRAVVDRALGAGGELATPDCGQGSSSVQYDGLFLLLQDGRFVGWVTGSPGLTTGDGLGVGSTLDDLRASFGTLQVSEGTVGVEWSTGKGGLAGFRGDDGVMRPALVTFDTKLDAGRGSRPRPPRSSAGRGLPRRAGRRRRRCRRGTAPRHGSRRPEDLVPTDPCRIRGPARRRRRTTKAASLGELEVMPSRSPHGRWCCSRRGAGCGSVRCPSCAEGRRPRARVLRVEVDVTSRDGQVFVGDPKKEPARAPSRARPTCDPWLETTGTRASMLSLCWDSQGASGAPGAPRLKARLTRLGGTSTGGQSAGTCSWRSWADSCSSSPLRSSTNA